MQAGGLAFSQVPAEKYCSFGALAFGIEEGSSFLFSSTSSFSTGCAAASSSGIGFALPVALDFASAFSKGIGFAVPFALGFALVF